MSLLMELPKVIEDARKEYETIKKGERCVAPYRLSEEYGISENILAQGDNRSFIKYLDAKRNLNGKIQMVYLDPPFFSKANYHSVLKVEGETGDLAQTSENSNHEKVQFKFKQHAYEDVWENGMGEYLTMLSTRLLLIKDLLKDDGTIWLHLDWHSVYYVKVLMDEIFGEKNFINEIVWTYKSGGSSKKHFARKHDTILVYGKSKKYYLDLPFEKSYNRGLKPYRFKGVKEYKDQVGWYTMVRMKDVWSLDMVGRTSAERTGYATQKPEALLERIIAASSRKGDICGDFFCGSGTLAAVATKLERRWICCDKSQSAIMISLKRVLSKGGHCTLVKEQEQDKGKDTPENSSIEPGNFDNDSIGNSGSLDITYEKLLHGNVLFAIDDFKPAIDLDQGSNSIKGNSLSLVGFWSIDLNYNGEIYRPDLWACRQGNHIDESFEVNPKEKIIGNTALAKVVDILGNSYYKKINIAL